jgi:hypothetical protein
MLPKVMLLTAFLGNNLEKEEYLGEISHSQI